VLSLAQFAYAAIGAGVSIRVSVELGFIPGVVIGAIIAAAVSTLLALPALRVRGLQLGVASLIFAVVTTSWLLDRDFLLGQAEPAVRPAIELFGIDTSTSRGYFWIALAALLASMAFAARLRSGAWGRTVVAVRDNEDAARALSLPARSIRLQTAAIGGLIAGIGGAIYGHSLSNIAAVNFPVQSSIDAVTVAVIGGLGSIVGPVVGALYLVGIPAFFVPTPEATSALAGAWLVLIVYQQGGLAAVASWVNQRMQDAIARGRGLDPEEARTPSAPPMLEVRELEPVRAPGVSLTPALEVQGVTKSYGGITAVKDVSLTVSTGETVGLIGPNGAGKTTVFEVVSGFVRPDTGSVLLAGNDITRLSPEQRSRAGIARSFQAATLFPTLTLTETVMVAEERIRPSSLVEALGSRRADRQREASAREALERFGLTRFADSPVGTLPTGTRRLAELACAVQMRPSVLLLDEPSAGIAHTETARLAEMLVQVREELGLTMVVIEHDLPLLADICDRMVAMNAGEKIADGTPDHVREHPEVIESYVG
jgi:ABC-type branched-subunit amino acid transport system ATPase component/ABC-type branched-subunit amino acid transport system permease subunit